MMPLTRNSAKNNKNNNNLNKSRLQTKRNNKNNLSNVIGNVPSENTNVSMNQLNQYINNAASMQSGNTLMEPDTMNQPLANTTMLADDDFKITYMTPEGAKMAITSDTPMMEENTQTVPFVKLGESLASSINNGKQYLLVMYDINAVGGTFIHMVVLYTQKKMRGVMKVKYFPPTPPTGTGAHKYIFELLEYNETPEKNNAIAAYFSSLASERTLKKSISETPEIASSIPEPGDITMFYEKVGVASGGVMKSMIVESKLK